MKTTHIAREASSGKILIQTFVLEGNVVRRSYGYQRGATQETTNSYGYTNEGDSDEMSPEETAAMDYQRIIKRKLKEGNVLVEDLNHLPDLTKSTDIDLNNIPVEFCCSKPKTSISDKELNRLFLADACEFQIKYNGLCQFILVDLNEEVHIYTRRWEDHTIKYPEIVEFVKNRDLPAGTLMISEFTIDPDMKLPHMRGFSLMSSIAKSNTVGGKCKPAQTKSFALQKLYKVRVAIFGILYLDNKATWNKPYYQNLELIRSLIPKLSEKQVLFYPSPLPVKSPDHARKVIKENKTVLEGLVIWDLDQSFKVTMNGKPNRCAAYKLKVQGEMDVICTGYAEGTGKRQGKIGSLHIGRYAASGEFIDMGSVGSGLKPNEGDCEPENWTFPCVIEVEYDQIFPDTGKLQFPRFSKVHEDKVPEEVDIWKESIR